MGELNKAAQDFFTLFSSIIVEATPFILIGIIVSVIVALFINDSLIQKFLPKNRLGRLATVGLIGIFMPVCECGNVPVARRMINRKFSIAETTVFLVAAPIVNPITLISTLEAFNFNPSIGWFRVVAGYTISIIMGYYFINLSRKKSYQPNEYISKKFLASCNIHHHYKSKVDEALTIFSSEFVLMFKMLILGAIIAALFQVIIPREWVVFLNNNPLLAIVSMMLLAFVISICSNIDAFFALSFYPAFPLSSLIAFMLYGPIVDIKMIALLKTTFTTKYIIQYVTIATALVLLISLGYQVASN